MLIEAELNSLIEYVNIWNGRFNLGLTYHGARSDRAAWGVGNSLITTLKAAPGLIAFEVLYFNGHPPDSHTRVIFRKLSDLIKSNYHILHPADYWRVPGESERIATKTLEEVGLLPILANVSINHDMESEYKLRLKEREPELTESEIDSEWISYCQAVEESKVKALLLEKERLRQSNLTAEQAAREFLDQSISEGIQGEPWKRIPDSGDNRKIIKFWHEGFTAKEIAQRVNRREKTIINRISDLRRDYGEDVVPRRR